MYMAIRVEKIAKDRGVSMAQVSRGQAQRTRDTSADYSCCSQVTTAWVLAQPQVTAPIIGVSVVRRCRNF